MITGAQQQRNATATQFDSSDFFVRRPEEDEGTLIVLTARIEESYTQEINLRGYLHQLLGILNEPYNVTSRELQKNPRGIWTVLRSRLPRPL